MNRTAKHEAFISEPMGRKSVLDLPGIGAVRAGRLERAGITTARQLASLYEHMGRNEFESFLTRTCGKNSRWTGMTIDALDEYNRFQFESVALTTPLGKSSEAVINVKDKSSKNITRTKSAQVAETFRSEVNQVMTAVKFISSKLCSNKNVNFSLQNSLTDLLVLIASLRSDDQKLEVNMKNLIREDLLKLNELAKLAGTVELLKLRVDDNARTSSSLDDKIMSCEKMLKYLRNELRNEERASEIKELNIKINSIEYQLVKQINALNQIIASKNDEMTNLFGKMNKFDYRIQKVEENNRKLNKKLFVMYCVNFLIVSTCLFFKWNV